ncbi:L,D-transpeptidase [Paraliobacillus sp. X-1268]|uniref:L,D-transpeptidase n=1 Tax=Paraliobacillus sp. X-1268 TaxID=2213193 RepID=UPI000E3D4181|nr:L,D-transpeptidase [Paraliobacillus sp. X-1268]
MKSIMLAIILIVSPLWPLGENPSLNAPFIIVNKQSNQLAFVNEGKVQEIYPVATGATEELTPNGIHTIIVKAINPYYRKKDIPGGDPKNPLGSRWIGFNAKETDGRMYGIHGTNQPDSIGKRISAGCIRMINEHVEKLYDQVPIGTKVWILSSDEDFESLAREAGAIE